MHSCGDTWALRATTWSWHAICGTMGRCDIVCGSRGLPLTTLSTARLHHGAPAYCSLGSGPHARGEARTNGIRSYGRGTGLFVTGRGVGNGRGPRALPRSSIGHGIVPCCSFSWGCTLYSVLRLVLRLICVPSPAALRPVGARVFLSLSFSSLARVRALSHSHLSTVPWWIWTVAAAQLPCVHTCGDAPGP